MSSDYVILPITEKLIDMLSVNSMEMDIKEIDNVYKNMKKELKEIKKEAVKKAKDAVKEANKKIKEDIKKNKKIDKNGEEKVKKLSKYNIFVRDIQPRIMEMYPGIANNERMGKIKLEWDKHKAIIARIQERKDEEEKEVEVKKETDYEDAEDEEDEEEKEVEVKKETDYEDAEDEEDEEDEE